MAEEEPNHENDETETDFEGEVGDDEPAAASDAEPGEQPSHASAETDMSDEPFEDVDSLDDHAVATAGLGDAAGRRTANQTNARLIGELHVFAAERTFVLPMDGDAAVRLLDAFRRGALSTGDLLNPYTSSAAASWIVLDVSTVVGMLWIPTLGQGRRPERLAVDPAAA